jgi:serine/threonine protein kinase
MELVEGPTLADRIARGPIAVEEAIRIFLEIAEGLEAAHERGVVHRDLKPAKVKVSGESGGALERSSALGVKILDFGLAKAMAEQTAVGDAALSNSPTLTLAATQRGQIMGTAAYMSPQQAQGQPVDRRADIWAFGVCLLEAVGWQAGVRRRRYVAGFGSDQVTVSVRTDCASRAGTGPRHQVLRTSCGTRSKCSSRLTTARPSCRASAEIQTSFSGIGVPRDRTSLRTRA